MSDANEERPRRFESADNSPQGQRKEDENEREETLLYYDCHCVYLR